MSLTSLWQLANCNLQTAEQQQVASVIQRIATGPELSKDISQEEAQAATLAILQGKIDPVRAAIFFIALRMKRETAAENRGLLDALKQMATIQVAKVDKLVDLADPYNGYNRTISATPFLPILLATCGVNCVTHGLATCGPKFGITQKQVLDIVGINTYLTVTQAVAQIENFGFSYIDQSQFCPSLYNLLDFRTLSIKRLPLTTVEVAVGPIRGKTTHLVTGFVHKPYPPIYGMLALHSGFDSAILIRGVEGGLIPSLRQNAKVFKYQANTNEQEFDYHPTTIDIYQDLRAVPLDNSLTVPKDSQQIAAAAAQLGLEALDGKAGPTYDALLYGTSIILHQLGRYPSLSLAADKVNSVLKSATARELIARLTSSTI